MGLRKYQEDAVNKIAEVFDNDNRAMLCLPTGAGKTYTFCEVAKNFFVTEVKKVLILVHRKELLQQAYESLGERCFKIEAGIREIPKTFDYYVGMVETTHNRFDRLPDFGLVIIDEAHIGNFNKLEFFEDQDVKILGVSATPTSANQVRLSDLYKNLIEPTTISNLIDDGFLLDCECWGFASEDVEKNSEKWSVVNGDYQTGQMSDFYKSSKMVETVLDAYYKKSAGKQTMVFNVNIEHNLEVYKRFKAEGLNAYCIDSTITSKSERNEIIENFKNDKHGIICNVGVLTTGFDCPSLETIILNRATKSLVLYLQMVGRGARISENKKQFTILDLGNNISTHGFYSDYRDWDEMFRSNVAPGDGEAPSKECPNCGYICHTRITECPSCGHVFLKKDDKNEKSADDLVLLYSNDPFQMDLERFFIQGERRGWKPYAYAYKIAEHLVNYQKRNIDLVSSEEVMKLAEPYFDAWMKKIGKRRTAWNRNYLRKAIQDKQIEMNIVDKLKQYHNEQFQEIIL